MSNKETSIPPTLLPNPSIVNVDQYLSIHGMQRKLIDTILQKDEPAMKFEFSMEGTLQLDYTQIKSIHILNDNIADINKGLITINSIPIYADKNDKGIRDKIFKDTMNEKQLLTSDSPIIMLEGPLVYTPFVKPNNLTQSLGNALSCSPKVRNHLTIVNGAKTHLIPLTINLGWGGMGTLIHCLKGCIILDVWHARYLQPLSKQLRKQLPKKVQCNLILNHRCHYISKYENYPPRCTYTLYANDYLIIQPLGIIQGVMSGMFVFDSVLFDLFEHIY